MNLSLELFTVSFLIYSILRIPDVVTTKLVASKLEIELHEVNTLFLSLHKRMGFYKSILITWFIFGIPIAILDGLYQLFPRLPYFAIMFGLFHFLAAANNAELHYRINYFGTESIIAHRRAVANMLSGQPIVNRITSILKMDLFRLTVGLLGIGIFLMLSLSSRMGSWLEPIFIGSALIIMIDVFIFFLVIVLGSVLVSNRWSKLAKTLESEKNPETVYVQLPVQDVKRALESAAKAGHDSIEFPIPREMIG